MQGRSAIVLETDAVSHIKDSRVIQGHRSLAHDVDPGIPSVADDRASERH